MRRVLLTLAASALAVMFTLACQDLISAAFSEQTSSTLFAPWILLKACVSFLTALCLFFAVWYLTKTYALLIASAFVYFVLTLPASITWLHHPSSLGDSVVSYTAVFLSQLAVVMALIAVFIYSKSRYAKL